MDKNFFNADEKIQMLDEIAEHYYRRNFGTFSKSDMDLLMFRFYVDKLTEQARDDSGVIDYGRCSDYKVSKDLGITQQRIRNLKVRKELIYPTEQGDNWKEEFARLVEKAQYDQNARKFVISIPDPNLSLEIQNFLEESGGYFEKQLNSKLLIIRAEYFINMIVALTDGTTRNKVVQQLKKTVLDRGGDEKFFDERNIGKSLLAISVNLSDVAASLSGIISPSGGLVFTLLSKLKRT